MGLFDRSSANGRPFMDSIRRKQDSNTLIYLDARQDIHTNSVITVAPNEQVIFIRNGEFYGTLPPGRHEVKTENYPVFAAIREWFSAGVSTFPCQIYHVSTAEQNIPWGTASPIDIQDYFLGGGALGVPTRIRGAADFRVRFNIREDDDAGKQCFMRLMGDKSAFSVKDLSLLFRAQISQEISALVGKQLEERSRSGSINAISSQLRDFAESLTPTFDCLLREYGLELVNFSFLNLSIDDTPERRKYLDRLIASAHTGSYDKAVQQELLKDIATNEGAGGIAGAGAGLGMGLAAGSAFGGMAASAFAPAQAPASPAPPDPMETLSKLKQMLDAGLITQQMYDAKAAEVLARM